ncbi:unnamed protein product [Gongylonema pulchrum]|uniref:Trehalase n=1 Tax=Gongylonema pulchrum TaxID=637853 RepID=A0A183EFT3_9BILA|nr:unnamed protein product [Gongylonema pulchrum]
MKFIYCSGRLLEAVNVHRIYKDSKTFVDMVMKNDPGLKKLLFFEFFQKFHEIRRINRKYLKHHFHCPENTLEAFNKRFGDLPAGIIDRSDLKQFLDDYFLPPSSELINCTPADWVPRPRKLMQITDPVLRHWALDINMLWKTLCKTINPEMKKYESRSSLIYLPHNFMIPGGRFREFYYWDTYWILKGLIVSDMLNTTREMILNLAHIVEKHSFIPNGGRIYYLHRSQPPVLCGMVYEYYESTEDLDFVKKLLPIMTKEFQWWKVHRTVSVTMKNQDRHTVFQYRTDSNVPRPESFREDILSSVGIVNKTEFWQDIASTAESGWDFSSRWLRDKRTLKTVETTKILPVDLNALMCWNMNILEYFYELVGKLKN